MGTPCVVALHGAAPERLRAAQQAIIDGIARLEARYSRYRGDSLTARINASAGTGARVRVDDETAALLNCAGEAWTLSGGLFDLSAGVLRRAWDFSSAMLPAPAQVEALLPLIGWRQIEWRAPWLRLPQTGMELDFGGLVKEYAAALAREMGVAGGWIELGGDVAIVGPRPDGRPWHLGIRDPAGGDAPLTRVALRAGAMASSGSYERMIEKDGRRYGHILDPRTGWPVHGPLAVSVLAPNCLMAGVASTVAMLKGPDAGHWLVELGLPYLLVSADGEASGPLMEQSDAA